MAALDRETRSPRLAGRRRKADQPMLEFPDPNAEIAAALRAIDVNSLTPVEALNRLNELRAKMDR